jgi:serine/threonine protein kinase
MRIKQFAALVGQEIGDRDRYLLGSLLASDETSVVFQGNKLSLQGTPDPANHNTYLIKVFPIDLATQLEASKIWQQQIDDLKLLQDPKLIPVLNGGTFLMKTSDGKIKEFPFLVTEPQPDLPTLAQVLLPSQTFSPQRAILLVSQIASALQVLYTGVKIRSRSGQMINLLRFWHGDLNPQNLLVANAATGHESIKLANFGIFKIIDELEQLGLALSLDPINSFNPERGATQLAYFAPEQLQSPFKTSIHTDIYAIGCLLYQMLSGSNPYGLGSHASLEAYLDAIAHQPPLEFAPQLKVPASLRTVVWRCLQKDPAQRYTTIAELQADLQYISANPTSIATITSGSPLAKISNRSIPARSPRHHRSGSLARSRQNRQQRLLLFLLGIFTGTIIITLIVAQLAYRRDPLTTTGIDRPIRNPNSSSGNTSKTGNSIPSQQPDHRVGLPEADQNSRPALNAQPIAAIASSNPDIAPATATTNLNLPPTSLPPLPTGAIATLNLPTPTPVVNSVPPPVTVIRRPNTVKPVKAVKPTPAVVTPVLDIGNRIEGNTQSITITINGHGETDFRGLLQRSEALANDAVAQAFSQSAQVSDISIAIFAERFGQLAPMLSADISRRQWLGDSKVQVWARYALKSEVLLGYAPPQAPVTIPPITRNINTIATPRVRSQPLSSPSRPVARVRTVPQPQNSGIPTNIPVSEQVKIFNQQFASDDLN